MITNCYKCGNKFECNPDGECWCKELEHKIQKVKIDNTNPTCLCKNCLNEKIALQVNEEQLFKLLRKRNC